MFTQRKLTNALPNNLTKHFVAHRGANNESPGNTLPHLPENTMPALLEAYKKGASYVECDIHLTADHKIIVLHDETLRRTTRFNSEMVKSLTEAEYNSIIDEGVSLLSYDKQISQVDAGCYADYLNNRYRGTQVPLLSDFLNQLTGAPDRKLVVELKKGDRAIVTFLTKLIMQYNLPSDQLIFISFDFNLIAELKTNLPEYKHLVLTVSNKKLNADSVEIPVDDASDLTKVIESVKKAKLDGIDLQYNSSLISLIPIIREQQLLTAVWTYSKDDNMTMIREMLAAGADFINTNQPEYVFSELAKPELRSTHLSAPGM